jgi:glycosyltransferase involved in cell wall biosynthesis
MRISIVIATLNAGEHLARCLDSCVEQTWRDKEIIVIDGGSCDGTVDTIRRYRQHIAYWTSEPDRGIFDAWNKALEHVTGTWVLFRGADDLFWSRTALEAAAVSLAGAGPQELVCYATTVVIGEDGRLRRILGEPWCHARRRFFQEMSIPHPSAFHRNSLFARFGRFDTSYRVVGDYDLLLRVLRMPDVEARFLPRVILTTMRDGGNSGKRVFRADMEAIVARRRNSIPGFPGRLLRRLCMNACYSSLRCGLRLLLGRSVAGKLYAWRHCRAAGNLHRTVEALFQSGQDAATSGTLPC